MSNGSSSLPASSAPSWLAAAALVLLTLAAYANTWSVPFLFDDIPSIVDNATIRHLWSLGDVLWPKQAGGITTSGRPLVNLSLALNHAISGERVWSYHVVNALIHLGVALGLMGVVRRTLQASNGLSPNGRRVGNATPPPRVAGNAFPLAFAVAALWAVHPLQTESVTYIVQRAESLCALFCVFTLYAFIRGVGGGGPRWLAASVAACALGMASKEVMVAAPLLVLLYDRAFVSGSLRAAWRERRGYYCALASTWLLLALLVLSTGSRGGTAGFAAEISPWTYLLTQTRALVRYLAITMWPCPLVFDYGLATEKHLGDVLLPALLVTALLVLALWALARRPRVGFLGACFFALLAPSSSVVPVLTQTIAEHRAYLASAAVIALGALGGHVLLGRRARGFGVALAGALVLTTFARNHDYRSELAIWTDTAAKRPANARAHNNLGQALYRAGRIAEAAAAYERALQLQPGYPEPNYNLGVALAARGQLGEALRRYETALHFEPNYPEAHNNLGNALVALGRIGEAIPHYEAALALKPNFAAAHNNLGNALLQANRVGDAAVHFRAALGLEPDYPEARYNLGNALAADGNMAGALEQYRAALAAKPGYAEAHVNAGNALLALSRPQEAIAHYEHAIRAAPALADAQFNLGSVLLQLERWADAIAPLETVLRLQPERAAAHRALAFALAKSGRAAEAIAHYETYLRAVPSDAEARTELAQLRAGSPLP